MVEVALDAVQPKAALLHDALRLAAAVGAGRAVGAVGGNVGQQRRGGGAAPVVCMGRAM